jgi:hypothetical protein
MAPSSTATAATALGLLAAACLACPGMAAWSDGDVNIDRPYSDLPFFPVNISSNSSLECFNLCSSTPGAAAWAFGPAGPGCFPVAQCWCKDAVAPQSYATCRVSGVLGAGQLPLAYVPQPVGSVVPTGWLGRQLNIQADGLAGYLELFWEDVQNSSWLLGPGDTGLHERTPYWLNGFIPMAYQLNDTFLQAQAAKYINFILENQAADGWYALITGPCGVGYGERTGRHQVLLPPLFCAWSTAVL